MYQWALPEDLQPLRECVLGMLNGMVDVVLFMTAVQIIHLFRVAEQMGVPEDLRTASAEDSCAFYRADDFGGTRALWDRAGL